MRITNPTLMRGYVRDYHRLLSSKTEIERKITSTRDFMRASQNPLSAAKALNVRKSYYYSEQHVENLKVASKFYTEAETSLLQVSDELASIRETIINAVNTTKDLVEWNILSQQLETKAFELCAIFNTDSADRAIFGGESDNGMPFTIINDANGKPSTVLYHGVPVNALSDPNMFPYSDTVYIDIGLGMYTDQKTHDIDSQSVFRTSFNGAKITGCGAEWGVADIDLSSVQGNRTYVLDVYAGNVKKTISFKYDPDETNSGSFVDQFNAALEKAYSKEINSGLDYPRMDAQGVVRLIDADGNPVESGIVAIVNNEIKNPNAAKLLIDNDSGYTDNYRLNFEAMNEGQGYGFNVTVAGVTKYISFEAGTSNFSDSENPVYGEDITVANFQKALDEAFGPEGIEVHVSDTYPTKGVITSEGHKVTLATVTATTGTGAATSDSNVAQVGLTATTSDKVNVGTLKNGETYAVKIGNKIYTFEAGSTATANLSALGTALGADGYTVDDSGVVRNASGDAVALQTVTAEELAALDLKDDNDDPIEVKSVGIGKFTEYTIDPDSIDESGEGSYSLKFVYGNEVQNISFSTMEELEEKLNKAFNGEVSLQDGKFVGKDGKGVSVADNSVIGTNSGAAFKRESVYSNNYIQLTLDAARALRNGDIEYANGCIDRIVSATENLLIEIADLGCNEEFIDFNINRITIRQENLADRQNDLEFIDPAQAITLWKQYEALYNAILQMSSTVVPQSIFNFMS